MEPEVIHALVDWLANQHQSRPANLPGDLAPVTQAQAAEIMKVSRAEIEAAMTPAGGFTKATLAAWGVPWPPPKGWRKKLEAGEPPVGIGPPPDDPATLAPAHLRPSPLLRVIV